MKSNLCVPILLSILLSSFYTTSTQSPQTITTMPFDTDGDEVQPGLKYYIAPLQSNDSGGGLYLATRDGFCPPFVYQETTQLAKGLPLRFLPLDKERNAINLSSDLNIVFNAATICVQSTVWKLSTSVGGGGSIENMVAGRRYYVRSGGVVGRPGVGTVSNWFRIEKSGEIGYKIVFCPSVCSSCKVVCGDVGVYEEHGKRWLALVDQPLVFTLNKA
ncbi:hypothetical protein QVD17_20828 [Tagetes erecta]|uniref:Uncharacterized protein n=1 Tax=Tagetes erecta TaxID=13708 RepID=A0AAD8NYK2_TARER|nr:hypothetical protein QVD17_20828 [Tagetes erecta]